MSDPNPKHVARAVRILKRSWHEATFMRGQTEPAAKHLFEAIHTSLKIINNVPVKARGDLVDPLEQVKS